MQAYLFQGMYVVCNLFFFASQILKSKFPYDFLDGVRFWNGPRCRSRFCRKFETSLHCPFEMQQAKNAEVFINFLKNFNKKVFLDNAWLLHLVAILTWNKVLQENFAQLTIF